jgi:predicted HTH transcriptional regulator
MNSFQTANQDTIATANFSDEVAVKLSALANAGGGILLIGIKDNGKVVGINPEAVKNQLTLINEKKCVPSLQIATKALQMDMKFVLEVTIAPPSEKPVLALDVTNGRTAYYRLENTVFPLSKIIVGLWNLQRKEGRIQALTADLDTVQTSLFDLFEGDTRMTLSQLYKLLALEKSLIDKSLIQLIYKGFVDFEIGETMRYFRK